MSLVPSFFPITAKYRGASSSKDYNTQMTAAYNDIVAAYAALQTLQANTSLANELINNQYASLLTQISALETAIVGLQQNYNSLRALNSTTQVGVASAGYVTMVSSLYAPKAIYGGFPSYFPTTSPMAQTQRANVDTRYGQIAPSFAVAATSKAYIFDLLTQTVVTPPNVAVAAASTVSPSVSPFLVEENPIVNVVDGSNATFWRRNLYFPANTAVSEVETTVTLTLPQQYINNLTCNYVTIHPYPEFGIDITSIVIHSSVGAGDKQLLNVDSLGNTISIQGAGKTRIFFPDQPVVSMDVTFRQATPNYVMKPGLQCFTTGSGIIDIGYVNFNQGTSQVLVPFTLANNFFQYVTGVGPSIPGVTFNLLYLDPSGDLVRFNIGDTLPGFVRTVYVEVSLNPTQGTLPVISQLQLQFYPTYLLN